MLLSVEVYCLNCVISTAHYEARETSLWGHEHKQDTQTTISEMIIHKKKCLLLFRHDTIFFWSKMQMKCIKIKVLFVQIINQ